MQIQCKKADLLKGISIVERAISSQDTLPVLKGIYLRATEDGLLLNTSNLELNIRTVVPALITQSGETIVDGKLFCSIIRKLPDKTIVFNLSDDTLYITSEEIEFSLRTLATEYFPEFPEATETFFSLPASTLSQIIKKTVFATASDESRPFLTGVLFEAEDNFLSNAATDSNRLVYLKTPLLEKPKSQVKVIIPAKALTELNRILPDENTIVEAALVDKQLLLKFDSISFATRLVEGQFPNYRAVFPSDQPIKITVGKQLYQGAVERASIMDGKGTQLVIFDAVDGVLEVSTPASDLGQVLEKLNVEHTGENGQAAYSSKYILEMLRSVDCDEVDFHFNSDLRQGLLRPKDDDNYLYVIMPVRIH